MSDVVAEVVVSRPDMSWPNISRSWFPILNFALFYFIRLECSQGGGIRNLFSWNKRMGCKTSWDSKNIVLPQRKVFVSSHCVSSVDFLMTSCFESDLFVNLHIKSLAKVVFFVAALSSTQFLEKYLEWKSIKISIDDSRFRTRTQTSLDLDSVYVYLFPQLEFW